MPEKVTDLYGRLFQSVVYPGYESVLRGRPTLQRLAYLEKTQWRSADELEATQEADLRRLVRHAYKHVPFYTRRFDAAGVGPDDIKHVADLAKLTKMSRSEARDTLEVRASTVEPKPMIRKTTGGTTGQPLLFGYDEDSEYWRQAVKLRGYGWAGYRVGDRTLHYWGAPTRPLPPRKTRAKVWVDRLLKREHYVNCTLRSDQAMREVVDYIRAERPQGILCYTQAGADLARFILEHGLRDWGPIPVLCCAERLFPADREKLQEAFGPAVFETYGCREVMLIGTECEAHAGLHTSFENLVVEVVVTENGRERPARPGETGEIVLTDLHNLGMPFIRYANGDLAVQGPIERCPCGRTLPRIASVDGRSADTLRDGNGNRVGGLVFNLIFSVLAATVRQFQAVQHKDGSVTLKLVPTGALDEKAQGHIRKNLEQYLPGVKVSTEIVADIPPSASGKRQVCIVEK
jgi:phenylacetate-CoA ligase